MCYYVNNMKRIIPAILLLLALTGCYNSGEPRERVLKIYNWADYIGEGVLEDFQAYYKEQTGENIRIVYQTFDINEIMLTKIEKGHEDFDVVCPSEYIIERMLKKHLLLPIDTNFAHSPNYMNNVAPFIRKQINKLSQPGEKASRYAVCYMWGTAGILYNRAYVPDSVALSWDCLWNKKYAGKILMKDSYRDAYGTAVIYAHAKELKEGTVTVEELMNDYSPRAMELAEKYLKALKPNIAGWEADFGKEMMTKNKAWLNMTWSGDAIWAIEEANAVGVDLDYLIPIVNKVINVENQLFMRNHPCISLSDRQRIHLEYLLDNLQERIGAEDVLEVNLQQQRLTLELIKSMGQTFCYEILNMYFANQPMQPLPQNKKDVIFQNFMLALFRLYRKERDVAYYAKMQHITPRYFSTIIKEKSGNSALQWIVQMVITEAKQLLEGSDLSIKEIANQLNFPTQSFFGKYFKQYVGISPKEYRKGKLRIKDGI